MPIHYTDPRIDVPPGVDFLDAEQVRTWVSACEVDKPWRMTVDEQLDALALAGFTKMSLEETNRSDDFRDWPSMRAERWTVLLLSTYRYLIKTSGI